MSDLHNLVRSFVWDMNKSDAGWSITPSISSFYGNAMSQAFDKLYGIGDEDPERLRMSALGYPIIYQMLPVLGFGKDETIDQQKRELFLFGLEFETRVAALLQAYDPNLVVKRDVEVEYDGIKGHADIVVEGYGDTLVIETKAITGYVWDQIVSASGHTKVRGYLTQLVSYARALGLRYGAFIMKNQETKQIGFVIVDTEEEYIQSIYERVDAIVPVLKSSTTLSKLFKAQDLLPEPIIPEPDEAFLRNGEVSFWTVPLDMKYCPHLDCLYQLKMRTDSKRVEVLDIKDYKEVSKCLKMRQNSQVSQ